MVLPGRTARRDSLRSLFGGLVMAGAAALCGVFAMADLAAASAKDGQKSRAATSPVRSSPVILPGTVEWMCTGPSVT